MELSPGYIVRAPMPLGPRVSHDGLFEGLAEPLVHALGGGDGVLGAHQRTISGNVRDGLDALFTSTIGAAEDLAVTHDRLADDQVAHALVDAGAGADAHRQSVLRYLPQPDAPILGDFRELPVPPAGTPGSGGGDLDTPIDRQV